MPGGVSGSTKIKAKHRLLTEVAWRYGSCSLYCSIGLDHIGLGDKAYEEQTLTGGSVCSLVIRINTTFTDTFSIVWGEINAICNTATN